MTAAFSGEGTPANGRGNMDGRPVVPCGMADDPGWLEEKALLLFAAMGAEGDGFFAAPLVVVDSGESNKASSESRIELPAAALTSAVPAIGGRPPLFIGCCEKVPDERPPTDPTSGGGGCWLTDTDFSGDST